MNTKRMKIGLIVSLFQINVQKSKLTIVIKKTSEQTIRFRKSFFIGIFIFANKPSSISDQIVKQQLLTHSDSGHREIPTHLCNYQDV